MVDETAYENGVYVLTSMNTLYITPPLTITREKIDEVADALDTALNLSDTEMVA